MTILDRDDLPIFTYVADMPGTCTECGRVYRNGVTVVRIGVAWASCGNNGWKHYHLECYQRMMRMIERHQK